MMPINDPQHDLAEFSTALAAILGEELADSLLRVGSGDGKFDLNMQLALNDGLEQLPDTAKKSVLALIDHYLEVAAPRT